VVVRLDASVGVCWLGGCWMDASVSGGWLGRYMDGYVGWLVVFKWIYGWMCL